MVLDPRYVGKQYPQSAPYVVGREKVREFATAIGEGHPRHHDPLVAQAEGHPDVVAPVTFPFVITMRALATAMFDPELGLDYSRVVHGEQSFDYVRPLYAGDEVTTHATITAIDSTGRHELLTLQAELRDEEGAVVVTSTSVIVSRGTGAGP
jgi:acyl dehydratase